MSQINRRWVLNRRPVGDLTPDVFRRDDQPIPALKPGEILVRNVFVPIDPGMRPALLDAAVGVDEFEPFPLGGLVGYMTVGRVEASEDRAFKVGEWVTDILMWQDFAVTTGRTARKVDCGRLPPTAWVGALGIPGLSAWTGLLRLGKPHAGETVVITSAAGTVGSIAGGIARNLGCRVIGIAGGEAKRQHLIGALGFDDAIDYRAVDNLGDAVRQAAPDGVDILFDNVGNAMVDAILPVMRQNGRIVICGQIADYHLPGPERPGIRNTNRFVSHRLSMHGLFVYDHAEEFPRAIDQMSEWIIEGRLPLQETVLDGFDEIPAAFARLFTGEASGRTIIRIDEGGLRPAAL